MERVGGVVEEKRIGETQCEAGHGSGRQSKDRVDRAEDAQRAHSLRHVGAAKHQGRADQCRRGPSQMESVTASQPPPSKSPKR